MLQMTAFTGEIPRIIPRLLPDSAAQIAQNCKLMNGAIVPLHEPAPYRSLANRNVMFFKSGTTWFEWSSMVDVAAAPIAADRLYVTGDGSPKLIVNNSSIYNLAVPRPATTLTAAVHAALTTVAIPFNANAATVQGALSTLVGSGNVSCVGADLPSGTIKITFTGSFAGRSMPTLIVDDNTLFGGSGQVISVEHTVKGGVGVNDTQTISILGAPSGGGFTLKLYRADPAAQETVVYAYTYVTALDEESEPSDVSNEVLRSFGIDVSLTGFTAPPTGRGINRIRLYRSQTSASGATELYFIRELNLPVSAFVDNPEVNPIQEAIPSLDYNGPPDALQGITALPNGMMAAFVGKKLYFSEPWKPHAWPEKYVLTTNFDIVGLGVFGQSIAVLTTGEPYIVTGNAPDSMVMTRIEVNYPCLSKRSIVDLGYSVAYATTDGIAVISSGGATLASKSLFTPSQWKAYCPSTMIAGQFEGRYILAYRVTNADSTVSRGVLIIDLTGEQSFVSRVNMDVDFMFFEVGGGTLYVLQGSDVSVWDAPNSTYMSMTWRSKAFVLPGYINFGAALVEGEAVPDPYVDIPSAAISDASIVFASFSGQSSSGVGVSNQNDFAAAVYADGNLTTTFSDFNAVTRLNSGFLARTWEVEVHGRRAVTAITLAQSPSEISMGGGQ